MLTSLPLLLLVHAGRLGPHGYGECCSQAIKQAKIFPTTKQLSSGCVPVYVVQLAKPVARLALSHIMLYIYLRRTCTWAHMGHSLAHGARVNQHMCCFRCCSDALLQGVGMMLVSRNKCNAMNADWQLCKHICICRSMQRKSLSALNMCRELSSSEKSVVGLCEAGPAEQGVCNPHAHVMAVCEAVVGRLFGLVCSKCQQLQGVRPHSQDTVVGASCLLDEHGSCTAANAHMYSLPAGVDSGG